MNRRTRHAARSAPRALDPFDGVLVVDKPSGPTSHDIVAMIRRKFRFRKVGHGGTLDPQATGLLVILIERGTKLSNQFLNSDKTYEGVMRLGIATDTQDAQGKTVAENDYRSVTREHVEAEMSPLIGDLMQTPPMISAAKKNGVPLYKLARKGKTVERKPKLIHIYEFTLTAFSPPLVAFVLRCTKGTYVRTLCADIGEKLGCQAHLAELRRTKAGKMNVEDAVPFDRILEMTQDELLPYIIPLHKIGMSG